jgi:hypothetical protein
MLLLSLSLLMLVRWHCRSVAGAASSAAAAAAAEITGQVCYHTSSKAHHRMPRSGCQNNGCTSAVATPLLLLVLLLLQCHVCTSVRIQHHA